MRKMRILWIIPALLLLLSSCRSAGTMQQYRTNHEHTYGAYYTVTPVSCLAAGAQMRYCSICREQEVSDIPVAEEIADRVHEFSATVVPPTESEWGYTVKCCNACGYTVDRSDERPPLYALLSDNGTATTPLADVSAALLSDTNTHLLQLAVETDTAVDADIARRLGVALAVTALLEQEDTTLTLDVSVAVTSGGLAGKTYTLRQLLVAWVKSGTDDVAYALADACGESMPTFELRVQQRVAQLGLQNTTEIHPVGGVNPQKTTLYDTAVLLLRALDTPVIAGALSDAVPDLAQISGRVPAVYLQDATGTLRVSALCLEDGTYVFVLLQGTPLPEGVEDALLLPHLT